MILNSYDGLMEKDIRDMTREDLVEAALRLLRDEGVSHEHWMGPVHLSKRVKSGMSVKYRFASSWQDGRKAEDDFCIWAESKGFLVEKAPNEMQFRHIDFYLTNQDGTKRSVDVKSRKRLSRTGDVQDSVVWIEFKNVQGKDGWLLSPHLDYLAFQKDTDIDFMLVKREKLLDLCKNLCSMTENAADSKDALYKKYTRRDRPNEHTSCVLLSDILTIEHKLS